MKTTKYDNKQEGKISFYCIHIEYRCINFSLVFYLFFSCLAITDAIDQLPLTNTPDVIGLNSNVGYDDNMKQTQVIWHHLLHLQPQKGLFIFCFYLFKKIIFSKQKRK